MWKCAGAVWHVAPSVIYGTFERPFKIYEKALDYILHPMCVCVSLG